jgi:type IV pilus assembly protein PilA
MNMNECQKLLHTDLETAFASNPQAAWERFKQELRGDIAVFYDFLIGKREDTPENREKIQATLLDAEMEAANAALQARPHTRKEATARGFSIIELLVVVAIILIIAAIAIPKLLSARAASQETAAVGTMKSVNTALSVYNLKWNAFPADLGALGGTCSATVPATATAGCTLDDSIAQMLKAGTQVGAYVFTYTQLGSGADFKLLADPATGTQAVRHFFADSGLIIHRNDTTTAAATDPTI